MILVLKRRLLITVAVVLCIILASCGTTAAILAAMPKPTVTVVLDAGHGGIDHGVIGKNSKVSEAEINLIMCKKVAVYLEQQGINVVFTRTNADSLADSFAEYTSNFKKQDMELRRRIIATASPQLVLSIHCNKFPDSSRRGAQVFYQDLADDGKTLASIMQSNLNTLNSHYVGKTFDALSGDYYILNCSKYTSAIVECGFLSNAEDDALLTSESYQDELAYRIYCGINSYLVTAE